MRIKMFVWISVQLMNLDFLRITICVIFSIEEQKEGK